MPREVRHARFHSRPTSSVASRNATPKALPQPTAKRDHQKSNSIVWFLFLMVTVRAQHVPAFGVTDVHATWSHASRAGTPRTR
jgi:hypothetical protein